MLKIKTFSGAVILLNLLLASFLIAWGIKPLFAAGDFIDIDSYIGAAIERNNIPGVALAYTQGENITYSNGYGTAGDGRVVTPDTPFYIGSQSKSFTALAIMQLFEKGKLELDMPVQTYLPWFRVADEQASQQITIRHLLQHTSGLSESGYTNNSSPDTNLEMLVRDLSRANLTAPVGAKMQYFNPGYSTLGLLIEKISGQSYGDYMNAHIFIPLKMSNTFTNPDAAKVAGLAQGYSQIFMFAVPLEQPFYPSDLPAGFIMSSANDMARYLMALSNGGELDGVRVLKPENVELIFTPNTAIKSTYGFGWYISKYDGETKITHGGDTVRFHTSVLLLPETNQSLVMLINENHLIKDLNEYDTIFWSVAGMLTNHPIPSERLSSIIYGWGLFTILLVILVMTCRSIFKLPQWETKMLTWDSHRRWWDLAQHLLGLAFSIMAITVIGPAFLNRAFSWKWFIGFLPDIAIVVGALMFMDGIQIVFKLRLIAKSKPFQTGMDIGD